VVTGVPAAALSALESGIMRIDAVTTIHMRRLLT